jgi:polynucleotide 5'-kinase involved in rRNA processing
MKKFLKIGLIAASLFTATGVHANDDNFTLKVKGEKEKFIRFSVDKAEDVNLSLIGADEEVLFEENIHASAFTSKIYDLNALPDGNYVLKVESELKVAKYTVTIKDGEALVSEPKVSNVFKPVYTQNDQVITLNLDNLDKNPIEIKVYNEYNDEVYNEEFKDKAQLTKKFNISKTDSKELTFVVKFKDESFVKTIQTY